MDFRKIEKKWQEKWSSSKLFESDVDLGKKFFTSLIIIYVNGRPHIGHTFTYTRNDIYARLKRMQGFNTLLAWGFHATGEPIVGTIERLKQNDKSQIETFKLYGLKDRDLKDFKKKGPEYAARFWTEKAIEDGKSIGFSVDWRRKFVTAIDPYFNRFIEWQYNTLKKMGYVVQGTHPVVWCPKDQSPTGDHDRLEGEGESPKEFIILKFALDDFILPCGTLRPETIYGVTNLWIRPDVEYVKAKVDGEKWILSSYAAEKLKDQLKKVKVIGKIKGADLVGKKCRNPVTNNEIPILPSDFVDVDNATGIVMSVPSHAPHDWVAIKDLLDKKELERYGIMENDLEPIPVVSTPVLGESPAVEITKKMGIKSLKQIDDLEKATSTVYKKEYHQGVLNKNCGKYAGKKVSGIKDELVKDFIDKNVADIFWEVENVVCRCTTKCHVKILENQWFLKYSDPEWKDKARKCVKRMVIYPEDVRKNLLNTIDWLNDKACARKSGLGTKLPWDKNWIVETLSDSTIYMAYYTIARAINEYKIKPEKLTDGVFDYVFRSLGNAEDVSKKSGLDKKVIDELKSEFEYYYPLDFRLSAKDLIQNHFMFFIFQHCAIWNEDKWPIGIGINGYVNVEGEKMSKSKGNIIPLRSLVDQYGADLTRINIACSSEDNDDADWRAESIKSYRNRIEFLFDVIKRLDKSKNLKKRNIDRYLESKLKRNIKRTLENYEKLKFRSAMTFALFENINELKWYLRRTNNTINKDVVKNSVESIVKLMCPIIPHLTEEMWKMLGNEGFVACSSMPKIDDKYDETTEKAEEMIISFIQDVKDIKKIAKIGKPEKVEIFIAENWKFNIYNKVLENRESKMSDMIDEIMQGDEKKYGKVTLNFVHSLYKKINELGPILNRQDQMETLKGAKSFLEKEVGCKVVITDAEKSKAPKAQNSVPDKPGIQLS